MRRAAISAAEAVRAHLRWPKLGVSDKERRDDICRRREEARAALQVLGGELEGAGRSIKAMYAYAEARRLDRGESTPADLVVLERWCRDLADEGPETEREVCDVG